MAGPGRAVLVPVLVLVLVAGAVGPAGAAQEGQPAPEPLRALVERVAVDVDAYWRRSFVEAGRPYAGAAHVLFAREAATGCGTVPPAAGAFYCQLDDTVYLGATFLAEEVRPFGDTAVAQVVAHEWGHHVQDQLGLFDRDRDPAAGGRTYGVIRELQADCLAGTYLADADARGRVAPRDIDEAVAVLAELGGDEEGTGPADLGAHGSGARRARLFLQGYHLGRGLLGCGSLAPTDS